MSLISASTKNLDEKIHVSETMGNLGRNVKKFDDQNQVSTTLVEGLATGTEFLSSKLCPATTDREGGGGSKPAGSDDDFPSSFTK